MKFPVFEDDVIARLTGGLMSVRNQWSNRSQLTIAGFEKSLAFLAYL